MLTKPVYGWSNFQLEDTSIYALSYLDDIAFEWVEQALSSQAPQEWRRAKTLMTSFIVWGSASFQIAWISENPSSGISV